jgi:hypothetical protein
MERRQFLKIAGASATAEIFGSNSFNISGLRNYEDLLYHKIADIKFTSVKLNYPRQVGKKI